MDIHPTKETHPEQVERICISGHFYKKSRFFAAFLICAGLLVAAFAVSGVWKNGGLDGVGGWGSFLPQESTEQTNIETTTEPAQESDSVWEEETIPSDAIPVFNTNLCAPQIPFYNETPYSVDVEAFLKFSLSSSVTESPMVLVLHTHAEEGYLSKAVNYLQGDLGHITYTQDAQQNVLAVGREFVDALNQKGIGAIHCTVMHDASGLKSSYEKAFESIQFFLTHYPSIQYVIDIHRDAVMSADGEYVRAVPEIDGESVAQVMCVVGSDGGGTDCPNWKSNFALALQLREQLNENDRQLCRPPSLRNATYNQELSPYSLLLEIGTGANTVEEAKRCATLVANSLANLILNQ